MRSVLNDFKDVMDVKTLNYGHINLDSGSKEATITKEFMTEVAKQLKAGTCTIELVEWIELNGSMQVHSSNCH
jgi:hypothetical protein